MDVASRLCALAPCSVWILGMVTPAAAAAAVIGVTTLQDQDLSDGECSLREAIVAANLDLPYQECAGGSGADEIELLVPGTILLSSDLPTLDDGLTLRGLGAAASTVNGDGSHRILDFPGPANGATDLLWIEGLRLTGGVAQNGGAVWVGNGRSLEIVDCVLEGNVASLSGGAVRGQLSGPIEILRTTLSGNLAASGSGGAVSVFGGSALQVVDSTVAGNLAPTAQAGGVEAYNVGEVRILRSTISGNAAGDHGGGLKVVLGGGTRVEYSTLVGNVADLDQDDVGWGGGVDVSGSTTLTLLDSIVADNEDLSAADGHCPDVDARLGAAFVTEGFNLIGSNECETAVFPAGTPNPAGDLVGSAAAPLDPGLGPLADNGGPTPTHRPAADSPLVDQGACPGELADQRGFSDPVTGLRVVDDPLIPDFADGCDIGAVERHPDPPAPSMPFLDGFESGDTGAWSDTVP